MGPRVCRELRYCFRLLILLIPYCRYAISLEQRISSCVLQAASSRQPAVKTRPFQSLIFLSFNDDTHGISDVDRAWFCDFER